MQATPHPNAEEILALRGKKSMGLIARQFGVSRNVGAGIFFRASHPGQRSLGTGPRTGPRTGIAATEIISKGGSLPGRRRARYIRESLEEIAAICRSETPDDFARTQILEIADDAITYAVDKADYQKRRREAKETSAADTPATYSARNYPL